MIDWDWTNGGNVNAWQSIATIAVTIIALFVIGRLLIKFWPWLKKVIDLSEALAELPAFIVRTDKSIKDIRHEVNLNNGASLKDDVRTVKTSIAALHEKVDEQKTTLDAADAAIREDLEKN